MCMVMIRNPACVIGNEMESDDTEFDLKNTIINYTLYLSLVYTNRGWQISRNILRDSPIEGVLRKHHTCKLHSAIRNHWRQVLLRRSGKQSGKQSGKKSGQ